jgi:hypothetical protein
MSKKEFVRLFIIFRNPNRENNLRCVLEYGTSNSTIHVRFCRKMR